MSPPRRVRLPLPRLHSLVEQPGVLAALTSRRPLVQIQPGLLTDTPVAQRRRHLPDVEATPQVRVLPGVLTAEWTGAWFPARSHKPFDAGSNPASATCWSGSVVAARRPGKRGRPGSSPGRTSRRRAAGRRGRRRRRKAEIGVRFPGGPLMKMGLWSNGKTPAWRAGNAGSTPAGSTQYGG
jgi:hypothetical protein